MALSKQHVPVRNLVALKAYAKRLGCRISESLPEDAPAPGVHNPKSFHYDTETLNGIKQSHAADINYGPAGAPAAERERMARIARVAASMGVSFIYALHGTVGAAAAHRSHGHADVGEWSNLGRGDYRTPDGDLVTWDTQAALHLEQDNLAGADTLGALKLLRAASNFGGGKFPSGVAATQRVVGVKADNAWGARSRHGHDLAMQTVQRIWRDAGIYTGRIDHTWGPLMDAALKRFTDTYGL